MEINYFVVAKYLDSIAKFVTDFLYFIVANKWTKPGKIHIIGHSLGAHIAGLTGKRMKENGVTVRKITGLDPAAPWVGNVPENCRFAIDDAAYTEGEVKRFHLCFSNN
jgi:thioesterase domain-containing protein